MEPERDTYRLGPGLTLEEEDQRRRRAIQRCETEAAIRRWDAVLSAERDSGQGVFAIDPSGERQSLTAPGSAVTFRAIEDFSCGGRPGGRGQVGP